MALSCAGIRGQATFSDWKPKNILVCQNMSPDPKSPQSRLYENAKTGKYVLAFRGTEELADWKTDAKQWVGMRDAQYDQARTVSAEAADVIGKNKLSFTGHSRGLAASAAISTGNSAVTFNAAAVSPRYGGRSPDAEQLIAAMHVKGEALSTAQRVLASGPSYIVRAASLGALHPAGIAQGNRIGVSPVGNWSVQNSGNHSMDAVINALEKR